MLALKKEDFKVLNLGVGEQDRVTAEKMLRLVSGNEHIKTSF